MGEQGKAIGGLAMATANLRKVLAELGGAHAATAPPDSFNSDNSDARVVDLRPDETLKKAHENFSKEAREGEQLDPGGPPEAGNRFKVEGGFTYRVSPAMPRLDPWKSYDPGKWLL